MGLGHFNMTNLELMQKKNSYFLIVLDRAMFLLFYGNSQVFGKTSYKKWFSQKSDWAKS